MITSDWRRQKSYFLTDKYVRAVREKTKFQDTFVNIITFNERIKSKRTALHICGPAVPETFGIIEPLKASKPLKARDPSRPEVPHGPKPSRPEALKARSPQGPKTSRPEAPQDPKLLQLENRSESRSPNEADPVINNSNQKIHPEYSW